jgi:hypothetical protein
MGRFAIALGIFAVGWALADSRVPERRDEPTDAPGMPPAIGSSGCAANGCHGNVSVPDLPPRQGPLAELRPDDCWKSSYLQWANHDKHSRAYDVLSNNRSRAIIKNWRPNEAAERPDGTYYWQCLACHSNPTLAKRDSKTDPAIVALQQEGVGCEACHGDARNYRTRHTGWTNNVDRAAEYKSAGMTPLYDPAIRAQACAGCHIGAPADEPKGIPLRDVTHDLIAAGHPRLNFEFTSYLRRMPIHWRERDRKTGDPRPAGFEEEFWAVGQRESAKASLKLLKDRATSAEAVPRWPELAEFNCYSCHHSLQPTGWRRKASEGKLSFGFFDWNPPGLAADRSNAVETALIDLLRGKTSSTVLSGSIDKEIAKLSFATATPLGDQELKILDWDHAARLYLALVAAANARTQKEANWGGKKRSDEIRAELVKGLRFVRPGRGEKKDSFDSPVDYDPANVKSLFAEWRSLLKRPALLDPSDPSGSVNR